MKTKLLKKVRKRFSITLFTEVKDPNHWLYDCQKALPLYSVEDKEDGFGLKTEVYSSYEGAYGYLQKLIRQSYPAKVESKRVKSQKVWYNENQK